MQKAKWLGVVLVGFVAWSGCPNKDLYDVNGDGIDDGTPTTTVISPSYPTGSVTGLVLNAVTGQALTETFTVHLTAGTLGGESVIGLDATVSDGSGRFRFDDVPSGVGLFVEVAADTFASAYAEALLNGSAGNFPTGNGHVSVGPFELIPLDGEVQAMVVGPDGRPVGAAPVYLDTDFGYFLDGQVQGRLHFASQTGDDGLVVFTSVPDPAALAARIGTQQFVFTVPPVDTDGVPGAELDGSITMASVATMAVQAAPHQVVLDYPSGGEDLRVVASNLADLINPGAGSPRPVSTPSVLPVTGTIYVAFNQPVDADSFLFQLVDETGARAFSQTGDSPEIEVAFNDYRNLASIALPAGVVAGQEYNLYIEARPAQLGAGAGYRGAVAFFIDPAATELAVSEFFHEERTGNALIETGDYIWFKLNLPVGARRDDGTSAIPGFTLPVHVQVVGKDVNPLGTTDYTDHPFEYAYTGSDEPPEADLIEKLPPGGQFEASGYTTLLRLTMPAGARLETGSTTFVLTFNDTIGADGSEEYRVTTPTGELPEVNNPEGYLNLDTGTDGGVADGG